MLGSKSTSVASRRARLTLVLLAAAFGSANARAASPPLFALTKPAAAEADHFGFSVALVGTNVLVGAPFDDSGGANAGSAFLFGGAAGTPLLPFHNPNPAPGDQFGRAVAGLGANVLIGAPYAAAGAANAGVVYLFDGRAGGVLQTFRSPTPTGQTLLGFAVATLGSTVVAGAPSADVAGADNAGAVYLFDPATGVAVRRLVSPDSTKGDKFGFSLATADDRVLVGAPRAMDAGAAYLFDGGGNLIRAFPNPTGEKADVFGYGVALVGGNVLVGAPLHASGAAGSGAAYLLDAQTGAVLHTFTDPAPAQAQYFGAALASVGNVVLIAAPSDSAAGPEAGRVFLFAAAGGAPLDTFQSPSPSARDHFGGTEPTNLPGGGTGIAASGTQLVVGAPDAELAAHDAGTAYVFESSTIGGGGGPCAGPVDCADADECTIDACTAGVCTHTEALGIDALICRLATLESFVRQSIGTVHGTFARNLLRRTVRMHKEAVRAKAAPTRRAHRLLRRINHQLGSFMRRVHAFIGRDRINPVGGAQFIDLATGARSRLTPLLAR